METRKTILNWRHFDFKVGNREKLSARFENDASVKGCRALRLPTDYTMNDDVKTCSKCGKTEAPHRQFWQKDAQRWKTYSSCRTCEVESATRRHAEHPNKREYKSWVQMRQRCKNQNTTGYENYGGRGISVDPKWESFETFLTDMGPRPSNHSLERVDVNGNYGPGNCVWATTEQQANNKRTNTLITIDGVTKTMGQWCKEYGIRDDTLWRRLERGVPAEKAVVPPKARRSRKDKRA